MNKEQSKTYKILSLEIPQPFVLWLKMYCIVVQPGQLSKFIVNSLLPAWY
jgi:hypothetical protein